jgi:hypothetical protein
VSWWTGDTTAADLKGLNNATLTNVTYAAGEVGQAFSFNGTNSWAALGDPPSLAFTASFTIEGWIKVNGLPTNYNFGSIMFRGDDRGGLDPYQLVITKNGDLQFGINSTTSGAGVEAPVPMGQLVHVAATLDDGTGAMTLYENGAVVAQTTTPVRPFGPLDPTQQPGVGIGNSNALSNYDVPFNGLIDELSVYNRALTAGEVQGIYSAGSAGKIKTSTYIAADFPSVVEGPTGSMPTVTFTLQRVGNLSGQAIVNWTTADGTATAGTDYLAASGPLVFPDGVAQQTVTVTVIGNNTPQPNRTFQLLLTTSTPGYAVGMGQATIIDDDVGVSVADSTATEGDARIGQSLGAFVPQSNNGGLNRSTAMAWGPDGNLYVGSLNTNQVLRFDGTTGAFLGTFIDASTGLAADTPFMQGLQFRPDGKLYVLSRNTAEVQRFDATTGAFLDVFIPSGSGGLNGAKGMTVGPDRNWYISSGGTNQILRYSGATGAFLGVFVAAGSGGLSNPRALTFGPDGNLYVSSSGSDAVLRYNGQTGAFINAFLPAGSGGLSAPAELLFSGGSLYVASQNTDEVLRYDAQTGAFLDMAATSRSGGLFAPIGLLLDSNNNLLVGSNTEILRYGPRSQEAFTVSLSIPSATTVTVNYATAPGTAGGRFTPVASGTLTFAPGQMTQTVIVPTINDSAVQGTQAFFLNLTSSAGATITRGQATGTIIDDDTTKFFVADGSSDSTYRYGVPGNSLANTTQGSGDTMPRGIASNAAGTMVWVVDANKNVYVYSSVGTLLGSWSAGGLNGAVQLTGITTNGTDIWLLDSKMSKVYKYTNAASQLSGSQSAASSFSLVSGRSGSTNPQDMVTDGTSFWVVDGSALKVFKYLPPPPNSSQATLLGSWAIDPANTQPTGITINPNNVSDIWIADSKTGRIYQYAGAANVLTGSLNATATFALAPGDTNPQGIADPPPADLLLTPTSEPAFPDAPSVTPGRIASPTGADAVAGMPSLASPDAVFALMVRESLTQPGEPSLDLTAPLDSPPPAADRTLTSADLFGGQQLPLRSSHAFRPDPSAVDLLDSNWVGEANAASALGTDACFALLAADAPAGP